jgi:threonylcarbamoyladenosine tRNA methylthiotransferase MtaB
MKIGLNLSRPDSLRIFFAQMTEKKNGNQVIPLKKQKTRLMKPKVAFYTFGCRLNQAETSIMQRSFEQNDYEIVDYRRDPDVVVVNTCTVTENGDADTRKLVNKINRNNPYAKIALVGCQAQVQREKLMEMESVNWVIGNEHKMEFVKILENAGLDTPIVDTPPIKRNSFILPVAGIDPNHTRANLKIQDGCDFFCSFCEIPYARGRARSRVFSDILKEARSLVYAGHRELVLTGINIGTYSFKKEKIADVISELERIDGLVRLRISSIEPTTIPFSILEKMAEGQKLCRYLHIPIQSGSDRVLRMMKRKYSIAEFTEFIRAAYQSIPDICLGTDVIVGFPGETDSDFERTYQLLFELPFAYFHVFSYSDRQHAKSSRHNEKVPIEKIRMRSKRLRELSCGKKNSYLQQFLGTTYHVLFEQERNGLWSGLTDNYIRVKVKSDLDLRNRLLPVNLLEIESQTMIGKLV